MRLASFLSLATVGALGACVSAAPVHYGQYSALQPGFEVVGKSGARPERLAVSLTQPAYVAVLFVVPGVASTLVYPTDSTTYNHLNGGTDQIALRFPQAPPRDSIFRRGVRNQRRADRRRGERPAERSAAERDTAARFIPDTSLGLASAGYLLMIASPEPLSYTAIKRHTDGVSIPLDDTEALRTVVKIVRSTIPEGAAWAGLSKEVDIDVGGEMQRLSRTRGR